MSWSMFVSSAAGIVAAQLFWAVLSFAAHGIRSAIAPRARVRTEADFEAEHALKAEAAEGGWQSRGSQLYRAKEDQFLIVESDDGDSGPWKWSITGFLPGIKTMQWLAEGIAYTEQEAQTAALDAARRLA